MMERNFIAQKTKELQIKRYLEQKLSNVGLSQIKLKKIPLGEKIIIFTSRPSLIVGSKGANIRDLTRHLKKEFKLENPQIEINEIKDIFLDANVVAERIASSLERFGSGRFKGIGHKTIENVMKSGAMGVEIIISGKIPGARARSWRFYQGYLKKCGDIALTGVRKSHKSANLKSGTIGIKVSIMPPDIELPDKIEILEEPVEIVEEIVEKKEGKPKKRASKTTKKKSKTVKKAGKKDSAEESPKEEETKEESETKEKELVEEILEKPEEPETKELEEETKEEAVEEESETKEKELVEEILEKPAEEPVEETEEKEE